MVDQKPEGSFRTRIHTVIFEADTPGGKAFDVALIGCIFLSVLVVVLESVVEIKARLGQEFIALEWAFTILFTIEYAVRLYSVRSPAGYARSFFGIVDLLAILPTYLSLVIPGAQSLLVIRVLRLLRLFRIFKLLRYVREARVLARAMRASVPKITIFVLTVMTIVVIMGALMYVIEGDGSKKLPPGETPSKFTNIPAGMYWAVVTMTTVGYGDITPRKPLGRFISTLLMILGYAIIAVPTGIVSVELSHAARAAMKTTACRACAHAEHDDDAAFCKRCGTEL